MKEVKNIIICALIKNIYNGILPLEMKVVQEPLGIQIQDHTELPQTAIHSKLGRQYPASAIS